MKTGLKLSKLKTLRNDFPLYARENLKIRTKSGDIEPLNLNKAQSHIHERLQQQLDETGRVRALILKGRQQGASTYIEGRFYWRTTFRKGIRTFILTHEDEATNNLFEMAKRYHHFSNIPVSTKNSNAKELLFDRLDSGYKIGTAGNKSVGRSATIQYFHGSEVAFWPNATEHAKGILQAIPDESGTEVILESTANGIGNYFHSQWQSAESNQSDYIAIFVPWYWQDEYRKEPPGDFQRTDEEQELADLYGLDDEQIYWRRRKIVDLSANGTDGESAFQQEYPFTAQEAFQTSGEDSLINPKFVNKARRTKGTEQVGPKLGACDPARYGDDRTSFINRQGRVVWNLRSVTKKDTMEIAGLIHTELKEAKEKKKPFTKYFIDVGGLGAGVYDRLVELGWLDVVVAVNGGEKPLDQNRYYNKRAEMWGEMSLWLKDSPTEIPDSDSLHADLCGPCYSYDSKTRLVLEKKEDMKKRGLRSPDEGDALALTFAQPVTQDTNFNRDLDLNLKWVR